MINQFTAGDAAKLKLSGNTIIESLNTNSASGTNEFYKPVAKDGAGQQKAILNKNTPELPAPFYDELHFANYE
jgi:hypothetical protein